MVDAAMVENALEVMRNTVKLHPKNKARATGNSDLQTVYSMLLNKARTFEEEERQKCTCRTQSARSGAKRESAGRTR